MPNFNLHLRRYRFIFLSVLLGALVWASALAAQEPSKKNTAQGSAQDSGIVLRQTVRRVRVDVVVTDGKGQPVKGLNASDFHVAEDGKPQSIRQFEYHSDEVVEAALPKRPPLPPHTFMNLPTAPEHGPLTVVLYDMLNLPMSFGGSAPQLEARAPLVKFLKEIPGQRVAIFVLGDQLRFVQGFTSDPDLIDRAIGDPATKPQQPGTSNDPFSAINDFLERNPKDLLSPQSKTMLMNGEGVEASDRMDRRVDMTTETFKQIANFLAGIPGRKNLIWYTGTFPINSSGYAHRYKDLIKEAVDRLNSAEVSVYSIDARGLMLGGIPQGESATLDEVSEQTGGHATYSTNALEEALEKSSTEGSSYYSLLYAPTNMKYDGSVRRISVHLGREHYHLAYRRSYIADDAASIAQEHNTAGGSTTPSDPATASVDSMAEEAQFGAPSAHQLVFAAHVDAIGKPTSATAEQMAAFVPYRERMAKAEHKKFVLQTAPVSMQPYAILYALMASQLNLSKSANGAYHSDLSIAALAYNQDGETLWGTKTRLKDDIPAAKLDGIRKNGYQAAQSISIPVETAVLRVVVRDEHSGKVGSMEIRLPLPPDKQQASIAR